MTQSTQKVNHAYLYNLANIPKTWYNFTDDKKFSDISVKHALNWLKLGWFFSPFYANCSRHNFGLHTKRHNRWRLLFDSRTVSSGGGASLYLNDTLDTSNMFKPAYSDATLSKRIKDICISQNITVADGTPISVDSIFCEYAHLDEFIKMGANTIEMESAAFFKAIKYITAAAVLVVSDNTSANQPLMDKDDTTRTKYRNARQNVQRILKHI